MQLVIFNIWKQATLAANGIQDCKHAITILTRSCICDSVQVVAPCLIFMIIITAGISVRNRLSYVQYVADYYDYNK